MGYYEIDFAGSGLLVGMMSDCRLDLVAKGQEVACSDYADMICGGAEPWPECMTCIVYGDDCVRCKERLNVAAVGYGCSYDFFDDCQ
jgi:hypothetical protein